MSSMNEKVGQKTLLLRQQRGLLQKDIADRTGLPARTIGRIERGEVDARLSTLTKIAEALGIPLKELLP